MSLDEDPLIHLDVALPQTASCLWMHHQSHQCRCRSRDREMQQKRGRKRANRWLRCSSAGRQATRRLARRGVRCPVSGPHGGNRHFQESCLAAMEPGRDSRGAGALQLQQPNHPHPIQLLEYQRGGMCLFDINLVQEARQSKPPLMHCADWAYNIIPAVTAMVRAAF